MDANYLLLKARRAAGADAYVMYPDNRMMIPETVLWGFASACLLEFVKPFFDFKGLGEGAHSRIEGLLKAWRHKKDFEAYCKSEGVDAAVISALTAIPPKVTSDQCTSGVKSLTAALVEVGLNAEDADSLAAKIETAVKEGL